MKFLSCFIEDSLLAVSPWDRERERQRKRVHKLSGVSLLIRPLIPLDQGPTLMTSSNSDYLPKAPFLNTITVGFKALAYKFGEETFCP